LLFCADQFSARDTGWQALCTRRSATVCDGVGDGARRVATGIAGYRWGFGGSILDTCRYQSLPIETCRKPAVQPSCAARPIFTSGLSRLKRGSHPTASSSAGLSPTPVSRTRFMAGDDAVNDSAQEGSHCAFVQIDLADERSPRKRTHALNRPPTAPFCRACPPWEWQTNAP
jgi:hypothetical protein